MKRNSIIAIAVTLLTTALLWAGPPLLCHPFDIGNAKSLPWSEGNQWKGMQPNYDGRRLVEDTVALLTPETPVIVRMETMRRATIYTERHPQAAAALLDRLRARATAGESKGKEGAAALFDYGYLAESFHQFAWAESSRPVKWIDPAAGIDGYPSVVRAIKLAGDPSMEFAAAVIASDSSRREQQQQHLARATAGAAEGSLLARNIASHFNQRVKTASN